MFESKISTLNFLSTICFWTNAMVYGMMFWWKDQSIDTCSISSGSVKKETSRTLGSPRLMVESKFFQSFFVLLCFVLLIWWCFCDPWDDCEVRKKKRRKKFIDEGVVDTSMIGSTIVSDSGTLGTLGHQGQPSWVIQGHWRYSWTPPWSTIVSDPGTLETHGWMVESKFF